MAAQGRGSAERARQLILLSIPSAQPRLCTAHRDLGRGEVEGGSEALRSSCCLMWELAVTLLPSNTPRSVSPVTLFDT